VNGTFRIKGGVPLHGEVTPIANKNALMGALPAAALSGDGILFPALPDTLDVHTYLEILTRLGAKVTRSGQGAVHVDPAGIRAHTIDPAMGRRLRGAFSLTGPLLARFGSVEMPLPGGCDLGYRAITTHLDGFRKLDVAVQQRDSSVLLTAPRTHAGRYDIWLAEASVSATLDLALYAAGSGFSLTIRDAACEPHVVEVLRLLRRMGVGVEGEGTNQITIHGPGRPLAGADFKAGLDYVDLAGSIVATAVTGGRLTIRGGNVPTLVNGMANWFHAFGIELERSGDDLLVAAPERLQVHAEFLPQAGRDLPKLAVRPWPGFPVDVLPVMVTLACKSHGAILFQNWMYESGFDYVRELNYLGAEILISDPQRVMVREPAITFRGGEIAAPNIIQGAKAIFLAALADEAETVIHGVDLLRRRYSTIFETYSALGARIEYHGPARAVQAGG
jgi:UDP-N-acetylglucosamine 1-carboxyvinyltransferase